MALDDLILFGLGWLFSRGKKAAPTVVFSPAPSPAASPASPSLKPVVVAPGPKEVRWPSKTIPKMEAPKAGTPLAFPASIPWAPMHRHGFGPHDPGQPARMRTGPVQAERQTAEAAIAAREQQPTRRDYWQPVARPTASDVATAKSLLPKWNAGMFWFSGPRTWTGRRMFLAKMHGSKKSIEVWQPVHASNPRSGAGSSATSSASGMPMIRRGSRGAAVAEWQRIIGVDDDGVFGPATDAATRKWQSEHGLDVDGVVGTKTWGAAGR